MGHKRLFIIAILASIVSVALVSLITLTVSATNIPSSFTSFIAQEKDRPASLLQAEKLKDFLTTGSGFSVCYTSIPTYSSGAVLGKDGGQAFTSLDNWLLDRSENPNQTWYDKSNALIRLLSGQLDSGMTLEYDASTNSEGWCSYIVRMASEVGIPITGDPVIVDNDSQTKSINISKIGENCTNAFETATNGVLSSPTSIRAFLGDLTNTQYNNLVRPYADAIAGAGAGASQCDELVSGGLASVLAAYVKSECEENPDTDGCVGSGGPGSSATTCVIPGIGWIVCPLATMLAWATDSLYHLIESFLVVQPLNTNINDSGNFIFRVWQSMLTLANVLFAISFIIIIFSQLTGVGITNYGVKKLLPRLIVAAILVNTSFWIAAIAVDLSNIAGAGIYDILHNTASELGTIEGQSGSVWQNVIAGLLAGAGTITAYGFTVSAVAAGGTATGAALTSALWSALPALLIVVLAVLIAFAVLAARQALIIILIILSPLAFVAYLLPNTEKYFTLWRKTLTTALIFYPLFALIFGGSQLAGWVILGSSESVDENLAIPMMILGLFAMAAPLVLTPLIIRFSTGVVGQVAGFVNNRSKGLIDRSRNTAQRKRKIASGLALSSNRPMKSRTGRLFRGAYQRIQTGAKIDKNREAQIEAQNQTNANLNQKQQQSYNAMKTAQGAAQASDVNVETAFMKTEEAQISHSELNNAQLKLDAAKGTVEKNTLNEAEARELAVQKSAVDLQVEAAKAQTQTEFKDRLATIESTPATGDATDMALRTARNAQENLSVARDRATSAEEVLQQQYARDLQDDPSLAMRAGGVDERGASRVVARAVQTIDDASSKAVQAEMVMLKHNRADTEVLAGSAGDPARGVPPTSGRLVDPSLTPEQRQAIVRYVTENGTAEQIMHMNDEFALDTRLDPATAATPEEAREREELIQVFGAAAASSGKVKSIGGGEYGRYSRGEKPISYTQHFESRVQGKKYKPETIASMDVDELKRFKVFLAAHQDDFTSDQRTALRDAINARMTDKRLKTSLNDEDRGTLTDILGAGL